MDTLDWCVRPAQQGFKRRRVRYSPSAARFSRASESAGPETNLLPIAASINRPRQPGGKRNAQLYVTRLSFDPIGEMRIVSSFVTPNGSRTSSERSCGRTSSRT